MQGLVESSRMLDRGGNPTVRQLLSSLVFNPNDGTIQLNGARIVMQRASALSDLRRELVRLLGEKEARVFLLRLGFMSGRSDARFVRAGWPNLDIGDAFTAGTRLHTFSGVVRVETVFNSYDFRKKRFSAEFLWRDSVEAAEFSKTRLASESVCWTQLGYASGYASEFFDTLIVYKEIECAAQGHSHCRVVGKPADGWGLNDPEVTLFRERIDVADDISPAPASRGSAARATDTSFSSLDNLILMPVRDKLDRLAATTLPVLLTGAPGTGRGIAARYLHRRSAASATDLRRLVGVQVDLALCAEVARPMKATRRTSHREMIVIDAVETIPHDVQHHFARAIEEGIATGGPRVVAVADQCFATKEQGSLKELFSVLSPITVRMPTLSEREGERVALARSMLPVLADRMSLEPLRFEAAAEELIEAELWPGNLRQMRNVLVAVLDTKTNNTTISAAQIEAQLTRFAISSGSSNSHEYRGTPTDPNQLLESEGFSLSTLEQALYTAALDRAHGNLSAAARMLGLTRAQFAYRVENTRQRKATGDEELLG
ncbi:transcriptional regulator with AAA-type ATPase domain [Rhizobium sp. ERR 922]|nr:MULTISPECIES: XylR N-terminal domain-containing protein [unclassified Rhizobium]TWB09583.1 transcriptional regulator with AAA-type ATPase domain [Rhizobium sp. ERR1071]TWB53139.1 transcriptional regulator with AAA-type ATPase domain [Rhizobium sp. ERR 922]TWB95896.1 transcriptional regulator with AAA-type ATPase domain [Rhizobium sp. ERR 942]